MRADKSTNLPDALIGKWDLNKMQGTMNKRLDKLLAEQEHSWCAIHQLEIQSANAKVEVTTQHWHITYLEEALQTSKQKTQGYTS